MYVEILFRISCEMEKINQMEYYQSKNTPLGWPKERKCGRKNGNLQFTGGLQSEFQPSPSAGSFSVIRTE